MRKEARGKLPLYAELKRLVLVERMSYREIGLKYDCYEQAVYHTLKRRAKAFGDPWPLQTDRLKESKKRAGVKRRYQDSNNWVKNDLLKLEIKDFCRRNKMTFRQFCSLVNISPSVVTHMFSGRTKTIRIERAHRIMAFIEAVDRDTDHYKTERRLNASSDGQTSLASTHDPAA